MCLLTNHETSITLNLKKSFPKLSSLNEQCYLFVLCLVVLKKNLEVFFYIIFKWQNIFFFFFPDCAAQLVGSQFPDQGLDSGPSSKSTKS